jgi:beta-lactam-binding protein with PASTA domain
MEFLKKFGRFILTKYFLKAAAIIVLIHVVIIGGTILYLDFYTNHGEKLSVPKLVGMNVNNVAGLLDEQDLKFEIVDQVYNPKLAEGTIVSQDPVETTKSQVFVKRGRTIRLRVSKRTSVVEMPSLIDKSERFATTILKNRGLRFKISYKNTPESSGAVLEQRFKGSRIKQGTKIPVGSMIQIIVGRFEGGVPIDVVDLWGLTISEARERLSMHPGIVFFPVCQDCATAEDSLKARINSQSPEFFVEGTKTQMPSVGTVSATAVLNFVDDRPKKDPVEKIEPEAVKPNPPK